MVEDAATVVIVSHNLNYLKQVCDRMVFIQEGTIVFDGSVADGINAYKSSFSHGGK